MSIPDTSWVPFELKSLNEQGEFTGTASPYGNEDLGGDIVDAGAFTKTIAERGNKVRLVDSHTPNNPQGIRIGVATVADTGAELSTNGKINLDKQVGRDAYSDLKFYRDNGLPLGLSIGYQTVKADFDPQGRRHLKEVRLWHISVTAQPMNEKALVSSIKSAEGKMKLDDKEALSVKSVVEAIGAITARPEIKEDFNEELAENQLCNMAYQMFSAIQCALGGLPWDSTMTREQKIAAAQTSLQQFTDAFMAYLPAYLDYLYTEYGPMGMMSHDLFEKKSATFAELKSGRMISAANKQSIKTACDHVKSAGDLLNALIAEEAGDSEDGKSATPSTKAAESTTEPDIRHSALIDEMKGLLAWNLSNKN